MYSYHMGAVFAERYKQYNIIGLRNEGNTCYLNTAIKTIASTPFISYYTKLSCSNCKYLKYYDVLIELLKDLQNNKGKSSCSAAKFKNELGKLDPIFSGYKQQDCMQAVVTIIDYAHKALVTDKYSSIKAFATKYDVPSKEKNNCIIEYVSSCAKDLKLHSSFVYDMFLNTFYDEYECLNCHQIMIKFNVSTALQLDIHKFSSLEDCIKGFFMAEKFKDYKCKSCEKQVELNITKFAVLFSPILIIHLKRAKINEKQTSYQKDKKEIAFTNELQLKNYIPQFVAERYYDKGICFEYQATAMAVHTGDLKSGHYYAYVLNGINHKWELHDDDYISEVSEKDVFKSLPIIIIYTRRDFPDQTEKINDYLKKYNGKL